jgi:hypothetical protein
MSQPDENLGVIREVAAVFTRLEIPYALGGSLASSLLGKPRMTLDADVCVEPFPGKEPEFLAAFGPDYYLSAAAVAEALRSHTSFNIIHPRSGFKVDVFIRKPRAFDQAVLRRRAAQTLPDAPEQPLVFVSAEDIVLFKLEWYRLGNESSDRQWGDILGVLQVQAGHLDEAYLEHWANELRVGDLLARARQEAQTELGAP